ncbi:MAG TPA: NAD(P)-dependent methylenetetrahydromethanopterin dehydrogenase [Methylophilaceae bacterium]|nr:NAD(P)-dependent methylenetetrahydromethanopterin dehydrogenase [Methylophilaceae bacterium]
MQKVSILHLLTAAKNASPFDVNMAYDAGFEKIMPYTNVELSEVTTLVQDAIFSRGPTGVKREHIFIGGRDIDIAMDMLDTARKAMVPPFEVSVFADPSGAFTTAAGMMAKVEQHLTKNFGGDLSGRKVSVFGATGPVGGCTAVIAAKYGAEVEMVAHRALVDVEVRAAEYNKRYGVNIGYTDGSSDTLKKEILHNTDIALCAAAAGIQVISLAQMAGSPTLKVVADVNAVPPTGAEGVDVYADGVAIAGTGAFGIGALAIGNVKYKTQHNLLKQMLATDEKLYLDFLSAFEMARKSL